MTTHPPTSALLAHSTRFWDKTARKYAAATIADMAGYEHSLQRVRQRLRPTDRVLELGSGTATTALSLAPATAHYTAADLSPAMVDIARQKLKDAPPDVHRMLHLVVADADAHLPAPAPAPVGWQGQSSAKTHFTLALKKIIGNDLDVAGTCHQRQKSKGNGRHNKFATPHRRSTGQ